MISICVSFCSLQNKLPLPQWLKKYSIISSWSSRSETQHDVLGSLLMVLPEGIKTLVNMNPHPQTLGKIFLPSNSCCQNSVPCAWRTEIPVYLQAISQWLLSASRDHKHSLSCATSIFNSTIKIIFFLCFKYLIFFPSIS